jgi:SAM-dependent methyltransferase
MEAQMTNTETFQLSLAAAETYETKFVPALFGEWAPLVIDAAGVDTGHEVLDVACGTGVVAREVAARVGRTGRVVGVDINDAMLTVARRIRPQIEWKAADVVALPFPDGSFDAVVCQAALMFFPDRIGAVREMRRVLKDDGRVAIQVWAGLDAQPAYRRIVEIAARHAGPDAVDLLSSYWVMGNLDRTRELITDAGLTVTDATTHIGAARFDSIDELVKIEVESTPLIDRIDDATYHAIVADAREALSEFEAGEGGVAVPIVCHIFAATNATPTASR